MFACERIFASTSELTFIFYPTDSSQVLWDVVVKNCFTLGDSSVATLSGVVCDVTHTWKVMKCI